MNYYLYAVHVRETIGKTLQCGVLYLNPKLTVTGTIRLGLCGPCHASSVEAIFPLGVS